MAELFKTYIEEGSDKYQINLLEISDTIPQSIIRHDFINADGALLTNMGLKAHEIKFKCFFFNVPPDEDLSYNSASYDNHFLFLNFISDTTKTFTLSHPKYGPIRGMIEVTNVFHDDTQEYAEIDLTFIESGLKQTGELLDIQAISNAVYDQLLAQNEAELANTNNLFKNSGFGEFVGKITDTTKKLQDCFTGISQKSRTFLGQIDSAIGVFDSFFSSFSTLSSLSNTTTQFIADAPGRLLGSINSCMQRLITSQSNIVNLPLQVTNNMILGVSNIGKTLTSVSSLTGDAGVFMNNRLLNLGTANIGYQAGQMLQTDETNRNKSLNKETVKSFNTLGIRVDTGVAPAVMSSTELDYMMYAFRKQVQTCLDIEVTSGDFIESGRDNQALREMAASMQDFINNIKIKRMKMVSMQVNNIPLHLLCNQLGLSYKAAERILQINPQIKNPTFVEGTIKVYQK